MASGDQRAEVADIDGSGVRAVIVRTRWNAEIVDRLTAGAQRGLTDLGVTSIEVVDVAGAFELPFAAATIARSGRVDAIVVVGAVIRGETTHYELVAGECGRGILDVQLATGVPIGMGVLTVENEAQAIARSMPDPGEHNVGEEAAQAAVEQALLVRRFA